MFLIPKLKVALGMVTLSMSSLQLQCPSKLLFPLNHPYSNSLIPYSTPRPLRPRFQTLRILSAKRTGKQRYPSEKKKLKLRKKEALSSDTNKFDGIWRLSKLSVPVQNDPGKDFLQIHIGLLQEIAKVIKFPVASMLPEEAFSVVRKSFDARKILKVAKFVYTVDMDVCKLLNLEPRTWDFINRLEPKVGLIEHMPSEKVSRDLTGLVRHIKDSNGTFPGEQGHNIDSGESRKCPTARKPRIAVVGSGSSGLFASLVLAEFGADVTLFERGQAVERRVLVNMCL
ncbi:putative endonuclease or glycosyl hydrolase [Hibiscus syriacus]|uniref:Endonuclease or glycosyl hydrolase n=1 Tax=Hibiscus syriacus TaxID=106335 RepID=A0A6A3AMU5_HIBSY|nr:putative endonuclease or glycosyl hydrolase [Hibiscus syriacus]